ncbi:hypothetical protein [Flammeovirga aprica]|uniref:DUF3887 domain-containing protein n=1 Tax=Flammeovirga aprica JL-4 TaxID=694437 RepID=A0A7X9P2U5_9BACT|nr:hypothetical protein [Flammeovirga aprica]NME67957.1 hypothetical protein [Flammeovirga aprica JL-4]
MKALFCTLAFFSLLFSSSSLMAKDEWFLKFEAIMNYRLDDTQARDILEEWVGLHDEDKSTYLYNLSTEELFCKFETGIRYAEITEITYTSGVVNVRMNVNEDAHIYVTFNRKTGKVIHCKASHR